MAPQWRIHSIRLISLVVLLVCLTLVLPVAARGAGLSHQASVDPCDASEEPETLVTPLGQGTRSDASHLNEGVPCAFAGQSYIYNIITFWYR